MLKLILGSLTQTDIFGKILGRFALPGDVILLTGSLGAGKTTLTQSIAAGLEVPDECYVVSPSYNLMLEYPGRVPLYHIDCYRLEGEDDVEGSGLMDYIVAGGLSVIEWPERLGSLKPPEYLMVELNAGAEESRVVAVTANGTSWVERIGRLTETCMRASLQIEK